MVEFEVDMAYLEEYGELDCVILHDENGEMESRKFVPAEEQISFPKDKNSQKGFNMKEVRNFICDGNIDHAKSTERLIQIGELVSGGKPIEFIGGEVYVPEKTCHIEHWGGSVFYLSCGHEYQGRYQPDYCHRCGAKVID